MTKQDLSLLAREDLFSLIGQQWMLITAGREGSLNTMTASWGGMGWLWNKPVAFLFVRPERFTHQFIEREGRVTLSFFAPEHKAALQLCGSRSGRDGDKIREAHLTPVALPGGDMTFLEARLTLDCRILYRSDMTGEAFLDKAVLAKWYNANPGGGLHTVYVAEIESLWA